MSRLESIAGGGGSPNFNVPGRPQQTVL